MKKFTWTRHAVQRCVEMLGPEGRAEVEAAILDPDISSPNPKRHGGGTYYSRGRIAVPVSPDGAILTVLWWTTERYDRPETTKEGPS